MNELTSKQRQYLKSLAHGLSPTVRLGRSGLTRQVINEADRSLEAHELIKARLDIDNGEERRLLASSLADGTASALVSAVGKIAVLYRARTENPRIKLP